MIKTISLAIAITAMLFTFGLGNQASAQQKGALSLDDAAVVIKQLMELRQRANKLQADLGGLQPSVLEYTCTSTSNACACAGVADCDDLRTSGECSGKLNCGFFSCSCTWH